MGMKPRIKPVETDINKRWEQGIDHHPESQKLMAEMKAIDALNGFECIDMLETGGDGDQGETLMYLMDIVFETRERTSREKGYLTKGEALRAMQEEEDEIK